MAVPGHEKSKWSGWCNESTPEMSGEEDKGTESQLGGERSGRTGQGGNKDRSEESHGPINPE